MHELSACGTHRNYGNTRHEAKTILALIHTKLNITIEVNKKKKVICSNNSNSNDDDDADEQKYWMIKKRTRTESFLSYSYSYSASLISHLSLISPIQRMRLVLMNWSQRLYYFAETKIDITYHASNTLTTDYTTQ